MDVFNWPALSPDLNNIENVLDAFAWAVYSSWKQFNSIADLKNTIEDKWAYLSGAMVEKYIQNM